MRVAGCRGFQTTVDQTLLFRRQSRPPRTSGVLNHGAGEVFLAAGAGTMAAGTEHGASGTQGVGGLFDLGSEPRETLAEDRLRGRVQLGAQGIDNGLPRGKERGLGSGTGGLKTETPFLGREEHQHVALLGDSGTEPLLEALHNVRIVRLPRAAWGEAAALEMDGGTTSEVPQQSDTVLDRQAC